KVVLGGAERLSGDSTSLQGARQSTAKRLVIVDHCNPIKRRPIGFGSRHRYRPTGVGGRCRLSSPSTVPFPGRAFARVDAPRREGAMSGAIGRVKKKVLPVPRLLSAHTRPPCASTIPLTIGRPKPVP